MTSLVTHIWCCSADSLADLHASHDVSQPRMYHQQVWRTTVSTNSGVKVRQVSGTKNPGTCE